MLLDTDALEKLEELRVKDKNLFEKVKAAIKKIVGETVNAYRERFGDFQPSEAKFTEDFGKEAMDELKRRWVDMITEAAKTRTEAVERSGVVDISDSGLAASNQAAEEAIVKYSRVTDKRTLDFLENQDHLKVYRAMALIDGKLYPPMATKIKETSGTKAKLQDPTDIGTWYQSDERPELADENGYFYLRKDDGSTIKARYNPYFHTSATPLNDQFDTAYKRPNLVVVAGIIPKSELTSGYKAEKAKDPVGATKWHNGEVAKQLKGTDKARTVYLSRWFNAERIVPDAEVARIIADTLRDTNIYLPTNVVTPSLLAELRKTDVLIENSISENGKKIPEKVRKAARSEERFSLKPYSEKQKQNWKMDWYFPTKQP